jgi:hypothetical protein
MTVRVRNPLIPIAIALLAAAGAASAADPSPSSAPAASGKEKPATLETVAGKPVKQVVLSAKAAERAGIQQASVTEQPIASTQMFGAMIVDAATAGIERIANRKALAVRVGVSPSEAGRIDRTKPARIRTLETRPSPTAAIAAVPVESASVETQRSGMTIPSYAIDGDAGPLAAGARVRAELPLQGGNESRKAVPYSAILYDAKGVAWVYVVTAPLHYLREPVEVERVAGDLAVLSKGPNAGTPIVTVGAPLLNGVEVFGK